MTDDSSATPEFDDDSGFEVTVTDDGDGRDDAVAKMRAALAEVRGEARKAAVVYAAVDAAFLALLANLLFRVYRPAWLPEAVALPSALAGAGGVVPASLPFPSLLGVALGVVAFCGEYALRTRRPLVEQFEAANPAVNEALRTARDTVERRSTSNRTRSGDSPDDGANAEMARRLYEDVLDRLRGTSSVELLQTRRVVTTTLLVVLVSVASIHVAVVGLDLTDAVGGIGGGDAADDRRPDDSRDADDPTDLRDGDQIIGDAEDVSAGDEVVNATLEGTGGGSGPGGGAGSPASYDSGGFSGDAVESQRAGFAPDEQLEDADLIREYNLRIRDDRDDEDNES